MIKVNILAGMNDEECWIQTYTGRRFYPLAPEKSEFCIEDIAHALSNLCRFTGHCDRFYSVAQHSVIVSYLVPKKLALAGLLHDSSEAYVTDIARPLKHLVEFEPYRQMESKVIDLIFKHFRIVYDPNHEEIKKIDALLLRREAKCLGLLAEDWGHYSLPDLDKDIDPVLPKEAKEMFKNRFFELTGKGTRDKSQESIELKDTCLVCKRKFKGGPFPSIGCHWFCPECRKLCGQKYKPQCSELIRKTHGFKSYNSRFCDEER